MLEDHHSDEESHPTSCSWIVPLIWSCQSSSQLNFLPTSKPWDGLYFCLHLVGWVTTRYCTPASAGMLVKLIGMFHQNWLPKSNSCEGRSYVRFANHNQTCIWTHNTAGQMRWIHYIQLISYNSFLFLSILFCSFLFFSVLFCNIPWTSMLHQWTYIPL